VFEPTSRDDRLLLPTLKTVRAVFEPTSRDDRLLYDTSKEVRAVFEPTSRDDRVLPRRLNIGKKSRIQGNLILLPF
jgi:hypothetical protein